MTVDGPLDSSGPGDLRNTIDRPNRTLETKPRYEERNAKSTTVAARAGEKRVRKKMGFLRYFCCPAQRATFRNLFPIDDAEAEQKLSEAEAAQQRARAPGARKFARKFTPTFVRTFRRQREIERRIMELNARNPETACPRVPPFAFHSAKARFAKCRDSPPASGDTSRFPTEKQAAWKEYQARNVRREYAKLTKDPHERGKLTETHRAHRAEKRRASKRAVAAGE